MKDILTWRKASRSGAAGDCVEVAFGPDGRATGYVRDSKSPERGYLVVTPPSLAALLADVKTGRLDLS